MPSKILIVEDDLNTLIGLQQLFESAGYVVVAEPDFRSGRRALEHERPDLLVVDLRLGGFNGLQLLHVNPRPIPSLVITGFPDEVLEADARRLGAGYLVKPLEPAALLKQVARLLASNTSSRDRRLAARRLVSVDLPVEINNVPARLLDASLAGVRFELHRPSDQDVPVLLSLHFPVHDLRVSARLVWSAPDKAGRWFGGAVIADPSGHWASLFETSV